MKGRRVPRVLEKSETDRRRRKTLARRDEPGRDEPSSNRKERGKKNIKKKAKVEQR